MAGNRVFRTVLLTATVVLVGACASQPQESLLETQFQRTAKQYQKYQHEGQVVYCKRGATRSMPPRECIYESALRQQVADTQRSRNAVARGGIPHGGTVPGGSGQ